ncbi:Polyadenylation factor subunit 2 [Salinomyces thailandicus]|uniref:Polyadenylation factor subunit 2 n=1 Tax=Salinomyces thailandicus TaxID=706561 RepID=A0A4U0U5K2_9PEZI|nr:Polyadenylation factor subunit 2 [Salinomyces thailandica]
MEGGYHGDHNGFDGGRRGRPNRRNATDIGTTYAQWLQNRRDNHGRSLRGLEAERPSLGYMANMLPPAARKGRAVDSVPAKHLHSSLNKVRQPVNVVKWTPEGRRLLTGSTSGEFTLWNGTGFNFETIMQAHDCAIRAIRYSHNDEWLLSADQEGFVKYWQPNFNNVQQIAAHQDAAVRDVAFAPSDSKFITASDDTTLKLWDFSSGREQSTFTGHQWDVKCADWHPTKGLIASGSKDHQVKLWDPRSGRCLTTLHGHKNTLTMTRFEPNQGVLLASCAREQTARIFDLRMMRDVFLLKGHEKEISCLTWHPIHSNLLTTGGNEGSMLHYLLDEQNPPLGTPPTLSPYDSPTPSDAPAQTLYPAHKVPYAHEYAIWSMDWHPLGHILASGSNDRATRFWTRPRPGDAAYLNDRWHIGATAAEAQGTWRKAEAQRQQLEDEAEDEAAGLIDQGVSARNQPSLPGLPGLAKPPPRPQPFPDGTSTGGAQPAAFPNLPVPGMDLAALVQASGGHFPPNFPPNALPPLPPGFAPPPGFPPLPNAMPPLPATATLPSIQGNSGRKRAPLPSQQESLEQEMRHGRYKKAR